MLQNFISNSNPIRVLKNKPKHVPSSGVGGSSDLKNPLIYHFYDSLGYGFTSFPIFLSVTDSENIVREYKYF